jgi:very-short-patch-repair endonuclease
MAVKHIVRSQAVSQEKIQRAKELRRNMTEAEQALWKHLRANRLCAWHFRRQQIIAGFIVDFYCHAAALVVEVDGDVHDRQIELDAERDRVLQERGFRSLRFPNEMVLHHSPDVLEEIAKVCKERTDKIAFSPLHAGEKPGEGL